MGVGEEKVNVKELGQGIICFILLLFFNNYEKGQ